MIKWQSLEAIKRNLLDYEMIQIMLVSEKKYIKAFVKLSTDVFCCKVIGKLFHSWHEVTLKVSPPSDLRLNFRHTKL